MRRLDDFNHKKPYNNDNKQDKRLGVGIVFIFIGALFIFSNIGLIPQVMKNYIFSLQMILIVIGIFTIAVHLSCTFYVMAYSNFYKNEIEKQLILLNKFY